MDVKEEQHVAIKFCCKVDISATKTVEPIQKAYSDATLNFRNRVPIYRTATLRYHPEVAFYIYFFNKYKY
jgi:hypothetical protein